jgi:HEAT repeat protein
LAKEKALSDSDPEVRRLMIEALQGMGVEAVGPLIAALKDENMDVRRSAARALGTFGRAAAASVPALETSVSDPSPEVRAAAAKALRKIRAP